MSTSTELTADCSRCAGLCCVALAFAKSSDFAHDKDAGDPCVNLEEGFGCRIHAALRPSGYKGCTVFDCFGAGQAVTQQTFGGRTWREADVSSALMFQVFPVVRQLHELLFYLRAAERLSRRVPSLVEQVRTLTAQTQALTREPAQAIVALDVGLHRDQVTAVLREVSAHVRGQSTARDESPSGPTASSDRSGFSRAKRGSGPASRQAKRGADLTGADLIGVVLEGRDLRECDLRGAYLIAADLRGCDLRLADLIGADLRDTDLSGADLSSALFVTQTQVNGAHGDGATRLPRGLIRPDHWSSRATRA